MPKLCILSLRLLQHVRQMSSGGRSELLVYDNSGVSFFRCLFVDAWQTGFRYRFFLSFLILKDGLARAYTGLGAWEI